MDDVKVFKEALDLVVGLVGLHGRYLCSFSKFIIWNKSFFTGL